MAKQTRIRSAITGKFTNGDIAGESPDTTVRETVKRRKAQTRPEVSLLIDEVRELVATVELPGVWFNRLRNALAEIDKTK
jgi:hypothetical protein